MTMPSSSVALRGLYRRRRQRGRRAAARRVIERAEFYEWLSEGITRGLRIMLTDMRRMLLADSSPTIHWEEGRWWQA